MADPLYCPWVIGYPCLKPEVWAAVWQAILAGLAILAAGRIAITSARMELSRKVDVYVHLIEMATELAAGAIDRATNADSPSRTYRDVNLEELKQVTSSLRAISLHDAPDYRLLPLILQTAKICEKLENNIRIVMEPDSNDAAARLHSASLQISGVSVQFISIQAKVIGAEYKESIFSRLGASALRRRIGMKKNS